ncbi:hypothetical protein D9M73_267020 [compost metagenome]
MPGDSTCEGEGVYVQGPGRVVVTHQLTALVVSGILHLGWRVIEAFDNLLDSPGGCFANRDRSLQYVISNTP